MHPQKASPRQPLAAVDCSALPSHTALSVVTGVVRRAAPSRAGAGLKGWLAGDWHMTAETRRARKDAKRCVARVPGAVRKGSQQAGGHRRACCLGSQQPGMRQPCDSTSWVYYTRNGRFVPFTFAFRANAAGMTPNLGCPTRHQPAGSWGLQAGVGTATQPNVMVTPAVARRA